MTCTTCNGRCPAPAACQQPERQFRPTFEVQGPYRSRTTGETPAWWAAVMCIAIVSGFFIWVTR